MNWQKITIWTLVLSIVIYLSFYYIGSHIDKFCFPDHYECLVKLRFGVSYPIVILFKYIIFCCFLVFLLPIMYKKVLYLTCLILHIIVFCLTILLLPDTCGGFLCFDKVSTLKMIQPIYPIVLTPTLLIT